MVIASALWGCAGVEKSVEDIAKGTGDVVEAFGGGATEIGEDVSREVLLH